MLLAVVIGVVIISSVLALGLTYASHLYSADLIRLFLL
jgi:hypothetical protein